MLPLPTFHHHEAAEKLEGGDNKAIIIPDSSIKNAQPSNTPMLREDVSGQEFLLDTGAAASIFPRAKLLLSDLIKMKPYIKSDSFIATAGGYELEVQGTIHLQLKFGGKHHPHTFLVAEVNQPILGYPFL